MLLAADGVDTASLAICGAIVAGKGWTIERIGVEGRAAAFLAACASVGGREGSVVVRLSGPDES